MHIFVYISSYIHIFTKKKTTLLFLSFHHLLSFFCWGGGNVNIYARTFSYIQSCAPNCIETSQILIRNTKTPSTPNYTIENRFPLKHMLQHCTFKHIVMLCRIWWQYSYFI